MDVPKYVPERGLQGLHSHETLMVMGLVYGIENAKLGGKMVYLHGLSNHGISTGPCLGGAYVLD